MGTGESMNKFECRKGKGHFDFRLHLSTGGRHMGSSLPDRLQAGMGEAGGALHLDRDPQGRREIRLPDSSLLFTGSLG